MAYAVLVRREGCRDLAATISDPGVGTMDTLVPYLQANEGKHIGVRTMFAPSVDAGVIRGSDIGGGPDRWLQGGVPMAIFVDRHVEFISLTIDTAGNPI